MLASKRKRYLSGPDWVINTLDHAMKATTCAGNMSQIALTFDSPVDEDEVRTHLEGFVRRFPVVAGNVRRDLKLAPYWRIPARVERSIRLTVRRVDKETFGPSFLHHLEQTANTPFPYDNEHLAFDLVTDGCRSVLSMTFDHRIFDARGAEMFLDLFQQDLGRDADPAPRDLVFTSSAALSQWSKKFLAGRNVNRRIISLSKATPVVLPAVREGNGRYRYQLLSFTAQETADIYERAYTEAGYLMESPYLLAVIIQSMHDLFRNKQSNGDSYLVPVTTDLRPGLDPLQEIFFNHVSYLFYQLPVSAAEDRKALIALLKQQMYDQVKSGFPRDLAEASLLTRIAPLPVLGKLLRLPLKGRMATFAFSHLGKSSYRHPLFLGKRIEGLFHMPRVPMPPGIGFFSNFFNGRLNLVLSHLDGLLQDADIVMIEQGIRQRFGLARKA
jgi:hypothetical protein